MSCESRLPTRENYTMSQCEDFLNWTWKAFRGSFPVSVSFLLFCIASPVYCLEKIGVKKGSGRAPQEKVPPLDGWRCLVPNVFVSGIYNAEKEPASIHLDKWQRHAEMCSIVQHQDPIDSVLLNEAVRQIRQTVGVSWKGLAWESLILQTTHPDSGTPRHGRLFFEANALAPLTLPRPMCPPHAGWATICLCSNKDLAGKDPSIPNRNIKKTVKLYRTEIPVSTLPNLVLKKIAFLFFCGLLTAEGSQCSWPSHPRQSL